MHCLCQVAYCISSKSHIFNEPEYSHSVLCRYAFPALQVLFKQGPCLRIAELLLRRHRHYKSACDVLGKSAYFIREPSDVVLTDICQHVVILPVACGCLVRLVRRCNTCSKYCLIEVRHFNQFVFDVRCVCYTVVVRNGCRGSNQDISKTCLAHIASAMIASKALDQHGGKFIFAIHEYQVVWNENILEDYHGFLAGIHCVAGVNIASLHTSCITGLPTIDVCNARSIDGDCANECIAFIFRLQSHCRHGDYPVGVDAASLMGFCACDVYSFAVALCHVHKHIRVFLLRRRQATVTLDVCHGTTDHQVFPLQHLDEFD